LVLVLLTQPVISNEIRPLGLNEIYCLNKQTREGFKMVMRLSEGVAAPKMPARPAPITAPASARLRYDSPQISTMSGVTKQWTPPAGTNPSPITVPSFQAQYNPQPVQSAPAPPYQAPFNPGQMAPEAPPAPPAPVVGGREWYNGLGASQRAATDQEWLGGDSDYAAQIGEYDRALQSFIDRITKRKALFDQDATDSVEATNKNETLSMNNLGEDFGARGLSFSGLFDQSKEQGMGRFRDTRTNITKQRDRNKTDADNQQKDYQSENQIGRGNARRAALQRMAADQALKDANNF
jgi:hypothetical protein